MRKISIVLSLLLCVHLAACSGTTTISSSNPPHSVPAISSASTAAPQSGSSSVDAAFLNQELISLVGGYNTQVKLWRDEQCCAYNVGSMTDALTYYNPYIEFFVISKGEAGFSTTVKAQDETFIIFPSNPFVDDIEIWGISLQADFDSALHKVTNQDSLKQLFMTDDMLTYDLISEKLKQSPNLEHAPNGTYAPFVAFEPLSTPAFEQVLGGTYDAQYLVEDVTITVRFVKDSGAYIAMNVFLDATKPAK